ncbi:hypothetical protein A8D66_12560 [Burkholderia cenocepacia]|nr:hypothetical protein A8D82_28545 [Burkholderia cenocepacia]ONN78859.1 hypothetical protein A8D63_34935 [Burkholderia cenocepacia]ONN79160.1 hypothetical protein A8D64_31195 [Burkholderia cenocepacia]ONN81829.1 hypothetical protein A8D62_30800 [Burkholderia cenocepacia]ONO14798.1 hypothetical protein A8D70_12215 [Burkholderia cenocepacia]
MMCKHCLLVIALSLRLDLHCIQLRLTFLTLCIVLRLHLFNLNLCLYLRRNLWLWRLWHW